MILLNQKILDKIKRDVNCLIIEPVMWLFQLIKV